MGITDFFRPKYRHSDVKVRTEAVRALTTDDAATLAQIARTDRDPAVRRIAIEKLDEAEVLAAIAKADDERALRDLAGGRAAELWVQIACDDEDDVGAAAALEGLISLADQRALAQVAARASFEELRRRALGTLTEARALVELARNSSDAAMRLQAVDRIDDVEALRALAIDVTIKEVGLAAVERLDDDAALEQVAQKAKAKQIRQRARKKIGEREEAARQARPQVSDEIKRNRAEKAQMVRRMELLAETFEWEKFDDEVRHAEIEWAAIGKTGEVALDERFARLVKRYRDRREVHFAKLDEARHARSAPEIRPPREEPEPRDDDDVEIVVAPAGAPDPAREARQQEAAARRAERDAKRAEEEARKLAEVAEREARRAESAERGKQIAISLDALCADLEGMIESTDQRAVQRALDQAAKAFDQISNVRGPERDALEKRYGEARAKLVIKIKDLRETEDWQRWANVPRQEALIKEAEALAASDAPTLPALQDVQRRWKSVGPVPQNKSNELWDRFKAAADAAFAKIRGARDEEKAAWAENVTAREALIAEATGLVESTDWDETADRLKGLQAKWKELGPVPRKQGDVLWKQFRAACDQFFERRKPVLDARTAELTDNLARKEALCAKVEALVADAPGDLGWGAAISAVKRAQLDWRDIGYVPRRDVDAIYARFRAACDALFAKRDQARDAEAEAERAEVEGLRGEIEAIVALADGSGARAVAVHAKLRELADRGLAPSRELGDLYERMVRHVIASDPAGLRGSELDPEAAQRKRDKIIARAEELAPRGAPTVGGAESAEDVAAKLRAALKSNALGGVRWDRDPRETIDELRVEWAAVGPVIGDAAEAARARFEEICAKVVAAAGGERERERERPVDEDRGPRRRERRPRRAPIEAGPGAAPAPAPAPAVEAATPVAIAGPEDVTTPARIAVAAVPELPRPPKLPEPLPPPAAPPVRARSITTPPPTDPIDDTWGDGDPAEPVAAAPTPAPAPEATQPAAGEMAGDGAPETDGIDAGWD